MDITPSKLDDRDKKLAEKLISLHHEKFPFNQLPQYEYNQLKHGVSCIKCHSLLNYVAGNLCVCNECGYEESIDSAIIRNVGEFKLLFPGRKITTQGVYEWSGGIISKVSIRRVLNREFKSVGFGRWLYYE
ncbi:hypothetical protein [Neobacillus endophyticus]|uniref:hypothetical protein n=1 Tax=Neobacillus endophyticus TaxID=2738405 RepID=UPI001C25CD1F|nr:hypothetical protein [Neobacillus endophyticus]